MRYTLRVPGFSTSSHPTFFDGLSEMMFSTGCYFSPPLFSVSRSMWVRM